MPLFPETCPLPRRTACLHVNELERERPGSSNTWSLGGGSFTGEGPHGALAAPSLMTKLWVKGKEGNSVPEDDMSQEKVGEAEPAHGSTQRTCASQK